MYRKKSLKIFTISCVFLALVVGHASAAIPEDRAEGFAMAIDIPVRVVSMGLIQLAQQYSLFHCHLLCLPVAPEMPGQAL